MSLLAGYAGNDILEGIYKCFDSAEGFMWKCKGRQEIKMELQQYIDLYS
jgi:hypothetical protein